MKQPGPILPFLIAGLQGVVALGLLLAHASLTTVAMAFAATALLSLLLLARMRRGRRASNPSQQG